MYESSYTWQELSVGNFSGYAIAALPFSVFLTLLKEHFQIPIVAIQGVIFFVFLLASSFSMFFITYITFREDTNKYKVRIASLAAALFYILNLYSLIAIWNRFQHGFMVLYSFLPLVFLLYVYGLKNKKPIYVLFSNFAALVILFAFTSPTWLAIFWILISLYSLFEIFVPLFRRDKTASLFVLRYFATFFILWLLLNSWWLFSALDSSLTLEIPLSFFNPSYNVWILEWGSGAIGSIMNVFRLFYHSYFQGLTTVWGSGYFSPLLTLLEFAVPIFVFLPLVLLKGKSRLPHFFYLLATLMIFLSKGIQPPFGSLYSSLFNSIPLFQVFRIPFEKFGPLLVFSYAPLFGIGVSLFCYEVSRYLGRYITNERMVRTSLFLVVCLLLIGILVWPMWTGGVFRNVQGPTRNPDVGYYTVVPEYYEDANKFFSADKNTYRLLFLPIRHYGGQVAYKWEYGYFGMDATYSLFDQPGISIILYASYLPQVDNIVSEAEQSLIKSPSKFWKYLAMFNIKYVILQHDLDYEAGDFAPPKTKDMLNSLTEIKYLETIGKLDIYKVDEKYFVPRIYTSSSVVPVNGNVNQMFQVIASDNFTPAESVLFLSEQTSISQWQFVQEHAATRGDDYTPSITFQKLNPTKYQISVTDATEPFFLVFSESYHPQWKAYVNIQGGDTNWFEAFFQRPISDERHFLVNGYANAWYIDPEELGTEEQGFTITLYYKLQSLFYLGCIISGLTFVGCIVFLVLGWRRRESEKRIKHSEKQCDESYDE
jgi:hypothetical protein